MRTHRLTQELGTTMAVRPLVLLATRQGNAEAVHQMVEARSVRCGGPRFDGAVASRLQPATYRRETYVAHLVTRGGRGFDGAHRLQDLGPWWVR